MEKLPKAKQLEKSPKTKQLEMISQIAKLKRKLKEMQEYKRLIAEDGVKPDHEDKRRESELIGRLIYLEKQLQGPDKRWVNQPTGTSGAPKGAGAGAPKGRRTVFNQRRRAP